MSKGFRKGKIPERFKGMTDEQILSSPAQYIFDSAIKEIDGQIVGYINHYFDTELAAVQIIRKIERLEKALDNACYELSFGYEHPNGLDPLSDLKIKWTDEDWKEYLLRDDQY